MLHSPPLFPPILGGDRSSKSPKLGGFRGLNYGQAVTENLCARSSPRLGEGLQTRLAPLLLPVLGYVFSVYKRTAIPSRGGVPAGRGGFRNPSFDDQPTPLPLPGGDSKLDKSMTLNVYVLGEGAGGCRALLFPQGEESVSRLILPSTSSYRRGVI